MKPEQLKERPFENGFVFLTSKSGGPGGQNVNKVNTKVELHFDIFLSKLLSDVEKKLISEKLNNKINNKGEFVISSQSERTQLMNKNKVIKKFYELVSKALTMPKKRRSTTPTAASKIKRMEKKIQRGRIKKLRNPGEGTHSE